MKSLLSSQPRRWDDKEYSAPVIYPSNPTPFNEVMHASSMLHAAVSYATGPHEKNWMQAPKNQFH